MWIWEVVIFACCIARLDGVLGLRVTDILGNGGTPYVDIGSGGKDRR